MFDCLDGLRDVLIARDLKRLEHYPEPFPIFMNLYERTWITDGNLAILAFSQHESNDPLADRISAALAKYITAPVDMGRIRVHGRSFVHLGSKVNPVGHTHIRKAYASLLRRHYQDVLFEVGRDEEIPTEPLRAISRGRVIGLLMPVRVPRSQI